MTADNYRNIAMKSITLNTLAAMLVASAALPAVAQTTTVFDNESATSDAVDDLQDGIQDDFDKVREAREFGGAGRATNGWTGSVSASASAVSGNTDSASLNVGARFGYSDGINGHDVNLSYTGSEADGETDSNSLSAAYEYSRTLGTNTYGYGQLSTDWDEFGAYKQDTFVGLGFGYRVINTSKTAWNVQAGPGWRFLEDSSDVTTDEVALAVGSSYYHELRGGLTLVNDTDILYSETDTAVTNEIGFNIALTGPLALRTSLITEYHTDPADDEKSIDNTLGLSLVYTLR
jgi:putative salt-induced outer membrane protein